MTRCDENAFQKDVYHSPCADHRQDVMRLPFRKICNITHYLLAIGHVMSLLSRISVTHILLIMGQSLMDILLYNSAAYSLGMV